MWALSSRLIYVLITFFLSVDARSKLLFGWWVRDPNWTIISYQDFTEKRYLRVDLYKSDFMQQPIIKITPTLFAEWAGRRHGWCKYLECERKQQGKKNDSQRKVLQADGQQLILHSVGRTEQRSKNNGGYHVQNRAWISAVSVYCDTYIYTSVCYLSHGYNFKSMRYRYIFESVIYTCWYISDCM